MRSQARTTTTANAFKTQLNMEKSRTHNEATSPQLLDIADFDGLEDLDSVWPPPTGDHFGLGDIDFVEIGSDFEAANDLLPNPFDVEVKSSNCSVSNVSKQPNVQRPLSLNSINLKSNAQIVMPPQKRKNSRKKQIEDLRELVAMLSQQLCAIKKTHFVKFQEELDYAPFVWRSVATRQLKLRLKAEESNASLRKRLKIHKSDIKNMKRRFKRRINEGALGVPILEIPKPVSIQDNSRVFARLLRDIDELYLGVDALFLRKTMAAVPCPGRTSQVYPRIINGVFVEFQDKSIVPFNTRKTCEAVWESLGHLKLTIYSHRTISKQETLPQSIRSTCAK